jgi:hypothetical protein
MDNATTTGVAFSFAHCDPFVYTSLYRSRLYIDSLIEIEALKRHVSHECNKKLHVHVSASVTYKFVSGVQDATRKTLVTLYTYRQNLF